MKITENSIYNINPETCILCYSCIRTCPVKAIEIKPNTSYARIVENRCVSCGSCVPSCPTEAITYVKNIDLAYKILSEKENIILLDPAIAAEFPDITDYRKFAQMLRNIGGKYIYDVSFGVDLMINNYQNLINNFKGKYYITSACPVIVSIVSKYYPDIIDNLIPILTPAQIMAKLIRTHLQKNFSMLFITSCTAAKLFYSKPNSSEHIDCVITFEELRQIFTEKNILESKVEYSDFDEPHSKMGSLFPIANGWIDLTDLNQQILNSDIITQTGKDAVMNSLDEFEKNIVHIKKHLNLFYCNGCLNGPGMTNPLNILYKTSLVTEYTRKRSEAISLKEWQMYFERHKSLEINTSYIKNDQRLFINEEIVKKTLYTLKKDKSNSDKGCLVCGYKSCYEFATYVAAGMAKSEMCLHYSIENRNNYIHSLQKQINELKNSLEKIKTEQKDSAIATEQARHAMDILNAMLQKLPSAIVIIDKNYKIVRSNLSFIEMLGQEAKEVNEIIPELIGADIKTLIPTTIFQYFQFVLENDEPIINKDITLNNRLINISIFSIKKHEIVGAVLRDLFLPEIREEEVISRLNEVIDRNLQMVQKIGFLLGEEAAATEQMLHSIIQTYKKTQK